jgi:hypothetical protein
MNPQDEEDDRTMDTMDYFDDVKDARTISEEDDRVLSGAASMRRVNIDDVFDRDIFFWNIHGGSFMTRGMWTPILRGRVGVKDAFRIIRVEKHHGDPSIAKVAIQYTDTMGKTSYISCRRAFRLSLSCLAEFREEIGEFETFTMSYCEFDNSFLFQSHNNYFMDFNEVFHTVAFKTCSQRVNGFPIKGRWDILDAHQTNRIGRKSAITRIPLKVLSAGLAGRRPSSGEELK